MHALAWVAAVVAFALELAALGVLGWGGWQLGGPTAVEVLLAGALPLVAALLWGLFAAPRAAHGSALRRGVVQALVFGAAAVLLGWAAAPGWGVGFAALVAADLVAARVLPDVQSTSAGAGP
ncbi:YrdB family protein [Modestobacter versicolor]|uniref:YrdB family protein n=1 Tax=Modestobacter versicolor TaxID=429133 RepID=UPI0034DFAA70